VVASPAAGLSISLSSRTPCEPYVWTIAFMIRTQSPRFVVPARVGAGDEGAKDR
jgi:hypothetical protein